MRDWIFVAGITQLGILIASALVPGVLDWRRDLQHVATLTRRMIWVHGAYVAFAIAAFGAIAIAHADELASGQPLARSVCAFLAVFWGVRLLLQYRVLDASDHLDHVMLRLGYHGLTAAFLYLTSVFACAAWPGGEA